MWKSMWKSRFKWSTNRGHQNKQVNKRKKKPTQYQAQDKYFDMAKAQGYRARSAFKLIEIQEKYNIIEEGMDVCDVWAAPWSFIQYIKRIIKDTGQIVGIDLKPIDKYSQSNINTIVHSIFDYDTLKPKVEEFIGTDNQFDLITSDIAPNTTWRKDVDQYASVELNIEILKFSDRFLKKWWNLLLKIFKWEDFHDIIPPIKERFERFTEIKPYACRDRSVEEFIICWNKK